MNRSPSLSATRQCPADNIDPRQQTTADRPFARQRARMVQQGEDTNQKNDNQQ
jgi:hypothetical protein